MDLNTENNNKEVFEIIFENNVLRIEIGEISRQANGSVMLFYKDTVILSVSVYGERKKYLNFLPLTVNYQEKLYAAGKIPGGFLRREGKPSDQEILCSRLIDRTLRPLFSKDFKNEVQLINMVLSSDPDGNNENIALFGSSLALLISDIPFFEPVSSVCVGKIDDNLIINPTTSQRENSSFFLILSGTKNSLNMVEMSSKEISENDFLESIKFGHEIIKKLCLFQTEIANKIGKTKIKLPLNNVNTLLKTEIKDQYFSKIEMILKNKFNANDVKKSDILKKLKEDLLANYKEKFLNNKQDNLNLLDLENQKLYLNEVEIIFDFLVRTIIRETILKENIRPDGRNSSEIRSITSRIDILPRTHGSALFTRGGTQSLSIVTLGTLRESKIIDDLSDEVDKRFMLHYNFPAFAVGSVGRYLSPSRREIGHGMLAEKALECVLPSENDFPYSIRVVSEILDSNGSSSQASICASSMALMAAGVPLKSLVAGVAMGLIVDDIDKINNYTILSDIEGLEDYQGDIDFKIAGTKVGITALQLDIKIKGITLEIFEKVLKQAKKDRIKILNEMEKVINKSRNKVSKYAPKVKMISINPEKIRDIIGSGGKIINQIIEKHDNVKIDIMQDGKIYIMHQNMKIVDLTIIYIRNFLKKIKVETVYEVKIIRFVKDKIGKTFGVIAEIFPGVEGFIHISKLENYRVDKVEDVLKIGQIILAKCIKINERGQIDLSKKDV
ncbi:polyribonucleotide nucleotidyltransferase [Candidatus Phytoplasma prunorum]